MTSSRERFDEWWTDTPEVQAARSGGVEHVLCWLAWQARDAEVAELVKLLAECGRTLKMWADVAPAISLRADIDALLAKHKEVRYE